MDSAAARVHDSMAWGRPLDAPFALSARKRRSFVAKGRREPASRGRVLRAWCPPPPRFDQPERESNRDPRAATLGLAGAERAVPGTPPLKQAEQARPVQRPEAVDRAGGPTYHRWLS